MRLATKFPAITLFDNADKPIENAIRRLGAQMRA